jgi:hypothetical protein
MMHFEKSILKNIHPKMKNTNTHEDPIISNKVLNALYAQVQRITVNDQIQMFLRKNRILIESLDPIDTQMIHNTLLHLQRMIVSTDLDTIIYLHEIRQLPVNDFIRDLQTWERYTQR